MATNSGYTEVAGWKHTIITNIDLHPLSNGKSESLWSLLISVLIHGVSLFILKDRIERTATTLQDGASTKLKELLVSVEEEEV